MKDTLLKKFLKFSYGSWVGLLIGVGTTMIVTRLLPPAELGRSSMYDLFIQIAMIIIILGSDQTFIRFFYEEPAEKRGALLYNTLRIPLINSIFLIILILLFYRHITTFLFGVESFLLGLLIVTGIIGQILLRFSQLVIRMQQKGNSYSLIQIFNKSIYLIFTVVFFIILGSSFKVLIFSSVITILLTSLIGIYLGKQLWSLNNIGVKGTKHSQFEIFKFGVPFVLTTVISWLFEAFGKIAIRQWSTFEELGFYTSAMKLIALLMILKTTFSTFWTPVSYERFEKKPEDREFFRNISIIVSFLMFLVAVVSIAAKDLIVVLLGSDYAYASNLMPFLVFMPLLYTISEITVIGINFFKKIHWHIVITLLTCGVNIIGNWFLVPEYGAIGASLSVAISYIIFITLRTFISLRYYRVNYPLLRIYLMILITFIYGVISIFVNSLLINSIYGIISIIILILLFYKDLKRIYNIKSSLN